MVSNKATFKEKFVFHQPLIQQESDFNIKHWPHKVERDHNVEFQEISIENFAKKFL